MAETNSTCAICGNGYYRCNCADDKSKPWKIHTDTSEHYKVFTIIRNVFLGVYTLDEAKEKLGRVDLSDRDTYLPSIKAELDKILNAQTPVTPDNVVGNTEDPVGNSGQQNNKPAFKATASFFGQRHN